MNELEKLNNELIEKLHQLEIAHKHCVNFLGKAFIEKSRDRMNSGIYFHNDFTDKINEINHILTNKTHAENTKKIKYEM